MTLRHLKNAELEAYLDGELPPGRFDQASRHLVTCASCAARLDDLAGVHLQLRSLPAPRLSEDKAEAMYHRIMESVRQKTGRAAPAGPKMPEQPIGAPVLPVDWKIPVAAAVGAAWLGLLLLVWLIPWPVWGVLGRTADRWMIRFLGLMIESAVGIWGGILRLQIRFDLFEPDAVGLLLLGVVLALELLFLYLLQPLASYERRGQ